MANMVAFYRQSVCDLYTGLTCPQAVIFIFHCHLECVMDANSVCCAAHAAAGHLLLSIATKVGKSAFYLSKQKAPISAKLIFSQTPADGSSKVLFYHPQTVNALLLSNSFPLPSARLCMRSPIHVGRLEGLFYHHQSVNALLLTISFPLLTCAIVKE